MKARGVAALAGGLLLAAAAAWLLLRDGSKEGAPPAVGRAGAPPSPAAPASGPAVFELPLAEDAAPASVPVSDVEPAKPPPAPDSGPPTLHAQVVRQADGSPIEGATAAWLLADGSVDPATAAVMTDVEGRFRLPWPAGASSCVLLLRWEPRARHLVAGPETTVPLPMPPCERRLEIAVAVTRAGEQRYELDTGWTIAGTAVDGQKHPLFGARFVVPECFATAESGRDGGFSVRDLPNHLAWVRLLGHGPGRAHVEKPVARPQSGRGVASVDVMLLEAGVLRGRVLYPSGAPAVGATVDVLLRGQPCDIAELRSGKVGDNGAFEILDLPAGLVDVAVRPDRPAAAAVNERVGVLTWEPGVRIDFERPARLEVLLRSGVEVAGRVVDSGGAPLPNHVVVVAEAFDGVLPAGVSLDVARAQTSAEGTFVMDGIVPGSKDLRVLGDQSYDRHPDGTHILSPSLRGRTLAYTGHVSYRGKEFDHLRPIELVQRLDVGADGVIDLQLAIAAPPKWEYTSRITGGLLDDQGHPVPAARIEGVPNPAENQETSVAVASANGLFEISFGSDRTSGWLDITADDLLARRVPVPNAQVTPHLGEIVLQRAPRLLVTLVDDATKDLVPEFTAVLQTMGGGRPAATSVVDDVLGGNLEAVLDRLEGTWVLTLEAPGWRRCRLTGEVLRGEEPMQHLVRMVR